MGHNKKYLKSDLSNIIKVGRVFGPTINKGKSQISPNVKLALQNLTNATYEPSFIMAVFWHCSAGTENATLFLVFFIATMSLTYNIILGICFLLLLIKPCRMIF